MVVVGGAAPGALVMNGSNAIKAGAVSVCEDACGRCQRARTGRIASGSRSVVFI
jgi:hypothetical protein